MNTYIITYNLYTLFKAILYTKKYWGEDKTRIIYVNHVFRLPALSPNPFNIKIVELKDNRIINSLPSAIHVLLFNLRLAFKIGSQIDAKRDAVRLVVFKDQQLRECILMNWVKRKNRKSQVILMEEGLALYCHDVAVTHSTARDKIKKLFCKAFNIPDYLFYNRAMGFHHCIDYIVCSNRQLIRKRGYAKQAKLLDELYLFSGENSSYLMRLLKITPPDPQNLNFVFLTQPITFSNSEDQQNYIKFLKDVFRVLSKYGTTFIKRHPRDRFNYDSFYSESTKVFPSVYSFIPYEYLKPFYSILLDITLYSSGACNDHGVFLYKMSPFSFDTVSLDKDIIQGFKARIPNSFNEFEQIVSDAQKAI